MLKINLDIKNSIKDKLYYEIDRYENMSSISPEVSVIRNYIEVVLNLPWNINSEDTYMRIRPTHLQGG